MKIFNKDIEILGDDEGYITLVCPYCKSEFKVSAYDLQERGIYNELFCPYCGLTKEIKTFYTREIKSKATKVGKENYDIQSDKNESSLNDEKYSKMKNNDKLCNRTNEKPLKSQQIDILGMSSYNIINHGPRLSSSKSLDMSFSSMEKQTEKDQPIYKIKMDNKKLQNVNVDRLKDKNLKEVEYICHICSSKERLLSDEETILYCAYCGVDLK
ncbi:hypothetical protein [Intestinibacter bartlettii]|uniref:Uncharacterized protein n=1 Tax=Intestinibacter bartlettii TaxID=261299 RepID=A0ABS6DV61_9FIRM|nr:hypothetical protein [Intestinibacter bartlettii]MBU5335730.1 hypothetical protein [Intestinibacter bartlettii]